MKRILSIMIATITAFMFMQNVSAAGANVTVSTSATQVIVGKNVNVSVTISSAETMGSWEFTLNYDQSIFKLITKPENCNGLKCVGYTANNNTKSVTYNFTFTALSSGTATFYTDASNVARFSDAQFIETIDSSRQVKSITYSEYEASLSKNNNLKYIGVDGFEVTPDFNKDVLEYTTKVPEDTKTIKIIATQEDGTASVAGAGEHEVSAGNNVFEIVVVAQNGSEKKYILNVEVIDKDPIEVTVNNKKYTVVKLKDNLIVPKAFNETTVNIDNFEIPAFYSEIMNITLVGLKDEAGNISLFIYKDNTYERYIELTIGNLVFYPLAMTEEVNGYVKSKIKIGGEEVECLETDKASRYKLVYGKNIENNEEGLYLYDTKDNVLIKYDEELLKEANEKIEMLTYSALALAGAVGLSLIVIIFLLCKKSKKKDKKKQDLDEKVTPEMEEPPKMPETEKEEDNFEENESDLSKTKRLEKVDRMDKREEAIKRQMKEARKEEKSKTKELKKVDPNSEEVFDIFEGDKKKKKKRK